MLDAQRRVVSMCVYAATCSRPARAQSRVVNGGDVSACAARDGIVTALRGNARATCAGSPELNGCAAFRANRGKPIAACVNFRRTDV
jgi:hypothetical protein